MQKLTLTIRRGETVAIPIRIESDTLVYKPISAIVQAGAPQIKATAHDCPDGWRAAVMNVKGPVELNAQHNPPADRDLRRATLIDANTVEFNGINAAGFRPYISGGQLVYYAPLDLASYDGARMDIKDAVGGTLLTSLSTADGTLDLDASTQTLWLRMTDEASATLAFDEGVFDIELMAAGDVTAVCSAESTITVDPEVTTST